VVQEIVRWWRKQQTGLQRADLDELRNGLTKTLIQVEDRLKAALTPKPPKKEGIGAAAVAAFVVAAAGAFFGYLLYSGAESGTPTATDPGRIGVAILGDAGSSDTFQVVGRFLTGANSSMIELTVTDFSGRPGVSQPPRVVVYLCGAIREGAEMTDLNRGDVRLQQVQSHIVYDSKSRRPRNVCLCGG
jgi:hypothetical protein